MNRTDVPAAQDERTMLSTFLDYSQATVHAKCAGLSDEDARKAPLPGSQLMTIAGLVSHLYWVQNFWFEVTLLGGPDRAPYSREDPDAEMRAGLTIPLEKLLADYEAQSARYRELTASLELDKESARPDGWRGGPVTLRWILYHLIEETSRHNGHIDLLRELADGVTGH